VEVGVNDVLHIPPNEPHRLDTIGDEPLGFLCIAQPKTLQK
jgi:mannose-6-phosphate isomerase-like protein (cupin superfamily)